MRSNQYREAGVVIAFCAVLSFVPSLAATTKFTPGPGDITKLSTELQAGIARTGLKAVVGKTCNVFVYKPEDAVAQFDTLNEGPIFFSPKSLIRDFSDHDMRRVILWESGAPLGKAVYFHYSVNNADYTRGRTYGQGEVIGDRGVTINTLMADPTYGQPLPANMIIKMPVHVDSKTGRPDPYDEYYQFAPYVDAGQKTEQVARKECASPPANESKQECFCVGTLK